MQIFLGILLAIGGILAIAIARWWVVLFHEMGHAIPALIFGDGEVKVLVGSYVERPGGATIQLGRLKLRAFFNLLNPRIGLCAWQGRKLKTWQRAIVLLGGPLASFILMGLIFMYLLRSGATDYALFAGAVLLTLAVIDLLMNLVPVQGVPDAAGQATYSDGLQLLALIARSRLSAEDRKVLELQESGQDQAALELLRSSVSQQPAQATKRLLLSQQAYRMGLYEEALEHYLWLFQNKGFSRRDYYEVADCYFQLNDYEKALQCLVPYEEDYHEDFRLYVLRARILIAEASYPIALYNLDTAVYRNPGSGLIRALRGLCLMREREFGPAKEELEAALQLAPEDAEVAFYHGQLLEERGLNSEALAEYRRAKELGGDFHGLDFRLESLT